MKIHYKHDFIKSADHKILSLSTLFISLTLLDISNWNTKVSGVVKLFVFMKYFGILRVGKYVVLVTCSWLEMYQVVLTTVQ